MSVFETPATNLSAEAKRALLARLLEERAAQPQRHPLSFAQQRLWFLDQMAPGSDAYIVSISSMFKGTLHLPAFVAALGELTRRHGALRTSFPTIDDEPFQVVAASAAPVLEIISLEELPMERRGPEARRLARAVALRPFDLSRGPLLRVTLLRLNQRRSLAVLVMHHIVSDGWSLSILVRELNLLYRAFAGEKPSPLPPLTLQYVDYVRWQRRWLQGDVLARLLDFWKRQLADVPVLELPTDRPRKAVASSRGATQPFFLPVELRDRLPALSAGEGTTMFMVLLAALMVLLHRHAGQEDLAIGSPIASRSRKELECLVGFFVNMLVLRTRVEGPSSFLNFVGRIRETALQAYAHQDLPFEKLVEELNPRRDVSRSVLFQVAFAFQNVPQAADPASKGPSQLLNQEVTEHEQVKFDLTFEITEAAPGLKGILEYNRDLFDRATIKRLLGHFENLLRGAAAAPGTAIGDLPLLSPAERRQLLGEWNDSAARDAAEWPPDDLLHRLIASQVRRSPDAVALIHGSERWTYAQLASRAERLAGRLRSLGVGPEVRVGIFLRRTPEMVAAMLAVLQAGGAYVPLDPAYPRERLEAILDSAGALAVMTEPDLAGRLPATAARTLFVAAEGGEPLGPGEVPVTSGCLAYVIYTSGSTGRPKGVAIEHRSVTAFMRWARGDFSPPELAGVLASTSICFDLSVFELFVPLCWGGAVILAENALELPGLPAAGEVTLVNTVPSAMAELVRQRAVPPSVRTVNLAGEPLRGALARRIHELGTVGRLLNLYGPSEDTTYSTWGEIGTLGEPTIGRPLPETRACVVSASLRPVPVGVPGELLLGGRGLSRGYLGRPELTAERYVPDPFAGEPGARLYRTGDLVRWTAAGELEYLGRLDHQVKVRGFRIELGEIEVALAAHPAVRETVVVAREVDTGGAEARDLRLIAYVALRDASGPADRAGELREYLRQKLPEYMVPAAWVVLEALPLTPNGKVDRKALPEPDRSGAPAAAYEPPANGLEQLIADVWRDLLRVERVGRHDNFFDLGGHSLLMSRVRGELGRLLGRPVGMVELFSHPRVVSLARYLSRGEEAEGVQVQVESQAARAKQGSARLEQLRQGARPAHA